jgi:hypothetical protein
VALRRSPPISTPRTVTEASRASERVPAIFSARPGPVPPCRRARWNSVECRGEQA